MSSLWINGVDDDWNSDDEDTTEWDLTFDFYEDNLLNYNYDYLEIDPLDI